MAPASFATLPLELKARIVEMASDQEEAWGARVKKAERAGHINCLSALALVNKELRGLAAKHQFRVLSAHRSLLSIFRYIILPHHGHLIKQIHFTDQHSTDEIGNAMFIMGQLPALQALELDAQTATRLFGPGVTLRRDLEDEDASHRAAMFAFVSSRIEALTLSNFEPSEAVALVRECSNLKTLALVGPRPAIDGHLGWSWPPEALNVLGRHPPPLKTVQFLAMPFDDVTIQLLGKFRRTLENLSLMWLDAPDWSSLTPVQLPHLSNLSLYMPMDSLSGAPRILTSSSTLSHLSLLYHDYDVDPADPTLLSFLDSQPTLSHIRLSEFHGFYPVLLSLKEPLSPSSLIDYADLVHSRRLDPSVLDQLPFTPFHPKANLDYTDEEAEYLKEVLCRTLEFGKDELERMCAEGSGASAVEWVEMLKALEEKRLAWKD
ncbi:hypothetical protein RQP46_002545 [Phenoliferia psychrophenolica]